MRREDGRIGGRTSLRRNRRGLRALGCEGSVARLTVPQYARFWPGTVPRTTTGWTIRIRDRHVTALPIGHCSQPTRVLQRVQLSLRLRSMPGVSRAQRFWIHSPGSHFPGSARGFPDIFLANNANVPSLGSARAGEIRTQISYRGGIKISDSTAPEGLLRLLGRADLCWSRPRVLELPQVSARHPRSSDEHETASHCRQFLRAGIRKSEIDGERCGASAPKDSAELVIKAVLVANAGRDYDIAPKPDRLGILVGCDEAIRHLSSDCKRPGQAIPPPTATTDRLGVDAIRLLLLGSYSYGADVSADFGARRPTGPRKPS